MQRVLIFFEDINELKTYQQLLRRVGFDVEGATTDKNLENQVISFGPDLIVAECERKKVNGFELGRRIKRHNGLPKVMLIFGRDRRPPVATLARVVMDGAVERPLTDIQLLQGVARALDIPVEPLLARYEKFKAVQQPIILGKVQGIAARKQRFREAVAETNVELEQGFAREDVLSQARQIQLEAEHEAKEIGQIDEERKEFVRRLMENKGG